MKSGSQSPLGVRSVCVAVFLLAALTGCRSAAGELVEAELRGRERQLDELKLELDHKDAEIQALEADITRLQRKAARAAGEPMGSALLVKKITLGRGTGGYDQDPKLPGDEALLILLEPRDMDDQAVKAAGSVHIDLYEINPQGLEFLISTWDLSAKEVRNSWDAPLIGGPSYRLILPWKSWPNYENVRLVVQFTTPEGQRFQADKKFSVRLPESAKPGQLHAPKPVGPIPSESGERPLFSSPSDQAPISVPPILTPPVPANLPTESTSGLEADGTSLSPRGKTNRASGVGLNAPPGARRVDPQ